MSLFLHCRMLSSLISFALVSTLLPYFFHLDPPRSNMSFHSDGNLLTTLLYPDVAHTHHQLDNLPCFKAQSRFVETMSGGCGPGVECKQMKEMKWTFDHWDVHQGDFTFLEKGIDLRSKQPKCLVGEFTLQHGCLIGKSVKLPWRHLDEVSGPATRGKEHGLTFDRMESQSREDRTKPRRMKMERARRSRLRMMLTLR